MIVVSAFPPCNRTADPPRLGRLSPQGFFPEKRLLPVKSKRFDTKALQIGIQTLIFPDYSVLVPILND
jgi:hypothetical protein